MRILIDIGHPAHVHLFKHFAIEMQSKGHKVLFTCRDKEFEIILLKQYGFQFNSFGKKYYSAPGKLWGMVDFGFKEFITGLKFKPDIFLSHGSIYAAQAAFLLSKPHISLEDTFNFEQIRLYKPFTKHILTSDYEHPLKSAKVIRYSGYHELAYLHPKWFSPDKTVLDELGVKNDEKYVILRFVSWNASHDIGHKGMILKNKIRVLTEFEKFTKVFISSEGGVTPELAQYRMNIQPHRMHDALAFSSLLFGESATMSEEAAILGVPGIFIFDNSTFYTKHLENEYQLLFNFSESLEDLEKAITKGIEILKNPSVQDMCAKNRQRLLSEKIDVTAFLVWFIENYPDSSIILKENPNYQYRFK